MLEYSEIKKGKVIIYEDEPYVILDNHVARTQQRKPQNQGQCGHVAQQYGGTAAGRRGGETQVSGVPFVTW